MILNKLFSSTEKNHHKSKQFPFLKNTFYIFTTLQLFCICLNAQNNPADGRLLESDILEDAVEKVDNSDISFDTYQENLLDLQANPINLNKAGINELRSTTIFTELQIRDLLRHIKYYGELKSIYELQTIPSFSMEDIYRIQPYITLNNNSMQSAVPFYEQLYKGDYQYFLRFGRYIELQEGYIPDSTGAINYYGNNLRIYSRFRYSFQNKLNYGITVEKDAGEEVFGTSQPHGFDYYSYHFFKKGTGTVKSLAIGDYELRIGQGLTMWSGFGFGKSVYPVAIRRAGPVLDAYTSVNENRFLRGAGATMAFGNTYLTVFGSHKSIDANISLVDSSEMEVVEISGLDESGLHRTESELENKDAITETMAGFDATYYKGQFNIGFSSLFMKLSSQLNETVSPYEIYDFSGNHLLNSSLHYNTLWRNLLFFGETAVSGDFKIATLNGIILPVDPKIDIAVLHRYFSPEYQSLYGQTFSEGALPQNEQGTYFGTEIKPLRGWKVSGYIDLYKNQWLRYQSDAPSYGTDLLAQLTWQPSKVFESYIRYKHEIKDGNASSSYFEDILTTSLITQIEKSSLRIHADYDVNQTINLKSRLEIIYYDEQVGFPEKGYLLFQDFNYHPMNSSFSFATRFAIFNTDSYNTRIYTYESEVLYAYSIVGLSGHGTRAYLLFTYSPFPWLDIWARVANTWYAETDEVGSGDNAFPGNTRSDSKLQVRVKW